MSAPRFFLDVPLVPDDRGREIELSAGVARHAAQVLRLRTGDRIVLFSGRGGEFAATIARIDRRRVGVRVGDFDPVEREPAHAVTLVQSLIAADMMDLVVRRAVELGASAIAPVHAARSQRIPPDRATRRVEHWRHVAIAACEQCGRNRVPRIDDLQPLSTWLASAPKASSPAIMLVPSAGAALARIVRGAPPPAILVGPEGGFAEDEVEQAARLGVRHAHLGPRVLRAETAALAALATLDAVTADEDPA